jgi:diguanylate cyclase (GGDEF)-like protein
MELEQENHKLRQQLIELHREAQRSQLTLERYHARELELMSADTLAELLHIMTEGMLASFKVDSIQLLLADPGHEIRQLLNSNGISEAAFAYLRFVDELDSLYPRDDRHYKPWLGPYLPPEHDILFDHNRDLKSIAILPLFCHNRLVGSINLGSCESQRFTQHHSSDFLARLGKIGGICLENTINRERLLISGLTDPLTELHNRRYLDRRLSEELSRANRYHQPLSCLFIDADYFKRVNDNYGHRAGDCVLRELANRIRSQLRASDVATRYGGEEFALLLPQTNINEAMQLAERIRLKVAQSPIVLENGQKLTLTVSIGVSETLPMLGKAGHQKVGEHLLANADQALYRAKTNGRNRIETLAHTVVISDRPAPPQLMQNTAG